MILEPKRVTLFRTQPDLHKELSGRGEEENEKRFELDRARLVIKRKRILPKEQKTYMEKIEDKVPAEERKKLLEVICTLSNKFS